MAALFYEEIKPLETVITLKNVFEILACVVAFTAGIGAIVALYKYITEAHDRAQKWDDYDKQIKDIKTEQEMMTFCMMATLDGLQQLGCNGKVTKAHDKLDKFINESAHK